MDATGPGVHSAEAARELSRGNSTRVQYVFTPCGGCLSTLSKSSVDSVPLRETPAALDSHQTTGEMSGRDGDPRPTSLHTPPPSAQLDSGVRWGLEGKPG